MGPTSLVKPDSLLSHRSLSSSFFSSFFFHFSFFLSSSLSILLFVLLQSKISPKDKGISAPPILSLSSPIYLPMLTHADPFDRPTPTHLMTRSGFVVDLKEEKRDLWNDYVCVCHPALLGLCFVVNPKEEKMDLWNDRVCVCVCVCRRSGFVRFVFWLKRLCKRWV